MSTVSDKDGADKDLPDEQQLEEYLRGGSDVSRQYRQLRSADVPGELDRLVLLQAEQAVKARPARSRTWMRWAGPLALAASAVLVLSIVIESGVHEQTYLTAPASAPVEMTAKQEAAEPPADQDKASAGSAAESSVVHIMPVSPTAVSDMVLLQVPEPELAAEAPAPFQDRAIAPPPAPLPEPVAPQFVTAPPPTKLETPPAELARRDQADAAAQAPARASAPAPAAVVQHTEVREQDERLEEVILTGERRRKQRQTAGPRNTIAAPAANDDLAGSAAQEEDEPRNYSDPEQWLRDIRQLRRENKHEEADREWLRFRYVFPNYEVADTDAARGAR